MIYLKKHLSSIHQYYDTTTSEIEKLASEASEALELLSKIANNVPGVVYQYRITPEGKEKEIQPEGSFPP